MPTVSKRWDNATDTWNFAEQVLEYWPNNYIKVLLLALFNVNFAG